MPTTKPGTNRGQRKIGLDKPCQICGKPIYYAYQGPYEGVCGRCTDRMKRKPRRRSNGRANPSRNPGHGGRRLAAVVLLAFLAGAVVMYLGHHHVLDLIRGLFR